MMKNTKLNIARTTSALFLSVALAATPALAGKGGNGGGGGGGSSSSHGGGNSGNHGSSKSGSMGGSKSSAKSSTKTSASKSAKTSSKSSAKKQASAEEAEDKAKYAKGETANTAGKLNGFLHASPKALAHASPRSAIGKVSKIYAGLLNSYLNPAEGETPPTIDEVAKALADAANKPLTPDIIAAVNQKLLDTDTTLSDSLTTSGKSADEVNSEVATALGV